jgi:hypothetical protein
MSQRAWGNGAAIGLIFLILLGGLAAYTYNLVTLGWQLQSVSENGSEIRKSQYTATGYNPEQRRCIKLVLSEQQACFDKAANAARENERQERDLVAQEVTAIWTKITAYAAIAGVAASIAGLGLVYVAYREARRTNIITRDVGEAQTRAYVRIDIAYEIDEHVPDDKAGIDIRAKVQNRGSSPAYVERFEVTRKRIPPRPSPWVDPYLAAGDPQRSVTLPMVGNSFLAPGADDHSVLDEIPRADVEDILSKKERILVGAVVVYRDVFGKKWQTRYAKCFDPEIRANPKVRGASILFVGSNMYGMHEECQIDKANDAIV